MAERDPNYLRALLVAAKSSATCRPSFVAMTGRDIEQLTLAADHIEAQAERIEELQALDIAADETIAAHCTRIVTLEAKLVEAERNTRHHPHPNQGAVMKLYEVPRKTWILVDGARIFFDHIDGAYSYCKLESGEVVHLSASTEVEEAE